MSKLPNQIDIKDLLSQLENQKDDGVKKVTPTHTDHDILDFITFYNIQPGWNLVRRALIYELYKRWSKDPVSSRTFSLEILKFIGNTSSSGTIYYLLNINAFALHEKAQKLLEEKKINKTKSKPYKRHFDSFISFYELKPGKFWVESFVLYYLYDKWTYKNQNRNPLSERQLNAFLKLCFTTKRRTSNRTVWYGITKDILRYLPSEHLAQLRVGRQFKHGKKDKSQKSSKTSGPKTTIQS